MSSWLSQKNAWIAVIFLWMGCSADSADGTAGTDTGPLEDGGDSDEESSTEVPATIDAAEGVWTWIDFPDSRCRDGSSTGIAVNLSSDSPNLVVYLDGGGACFEDVTCSLNDDHFAESDFEGPEEGIFDRDAAKNPVRDWSFAFVPYCTGDGHAGSNLSGTPPRVDGVQQFAGNDNLALFLDWLAPRFPDAEHVLFTGSSAGGFGVLMSAEEAATRFSSIPLTVVSDSGPAMSAEVVPPCLQHHWRTLWGLDDSVIRECGEDCPDPDDYMMDLALLMSARHPEVTVGVISSTEDEVNRRFFSAGAEECAVLDPAMTPGQVLAFVANPENVVTPQSFEDGLIEFREAVKEKEAAYGTYYIRSSYHVWFGSDVFYQEELDGSTPASWLGDLLAGVVTHIGP
jgi:hypothetical protein